MRIGILVIVAVFAVACKNGKEAKEPGDAPQELEATSCPSSIDQTFTGKSLPTNAANNAVTSKWRHELVASQPGTPDATVKATSEFKTHKKNEVANAACPTEYKYGTQLEKIDWEQTYPDGSMFKGKAKDPAVVCTDGANYFVDVKGGEITSGTGCFKGAKGTWSAKITVGYHCPQGAGHCPTDGNFKAKLQY